MQWEEIIKFLGGAAAISGTIAFLGKKVFEAFLAGRIEAYKNNLEKITNEHAVRFKHLHSERAETIKTLYEKLVLFDDTLHSALRQFQAGDEPSLEEKITKLSEQFNDLREYFLPKRIFFEQNICEMIDRIIETAHGVFIDITTLPVDPQGVQYRYDKGLLQERHQFWQQARNIHSNELRQIKKELENRFRTILGINA